MAKVSDMFLPVNVNGLTFYTRRTLDEQARDAVRVADPAEADVETVAMQWQWNTFVSAASPSGWKN